MTQTKLIDPDIVGHLVAEGLEIINAHSDSDSVDLKAWLAQEHGAANTLQPLQRSADEARALLDDASILNDPQKQVRVIVAYGAISGILSSYGIDV